MKNALIIFLFFLCHNIFPTTYYVSVNGSNSYTGLDENNPFQTIQYAIDAMVYGDILIVMNGEYSGSFHLKSGISIIANEARNVVFTNLKNISGEFVLHSPNIYAIPINSSPSQLFYKREPMSWASWPNITWSQNWQKNKKWVSAGLGSGPGVFTSNRFTEIY